ncbi:MAG: flagellar biosynthesis protein FlhF [Polyangiaceae bacterium]|nr:flagellar biosynthesis protein FlhF [Polyangiaceae bacterium]MCB9605886.1 flagellar biosynthesis protein FlhF [Polyangiaceae bacterium]
MTQQVFRGNDVREALAHVRAALGADAVIESTRQVSSGGRGGYVEVTAGPGQNSRAKPFTPELQEQSAPKRSVRRWNMPKTPRRGSEREAPSALRNMAPAEIERELLELRAMLEEINASRPPKERVQQLLHSIGIEGKLSQELARGAGRVAKDEAALKRWLRKRIGERLLLLPNLLNRPGRQVLTVVGPTGVGKTTTLAKLAAQAKLDLGRSVAVLTLDTFRVGAVEQWRRYAQLLGIELEVIKRHDDFAEAIARTRAEVILVDTPGRTPNDYGPTALLSRCLQSCSITQETLLVLPGWMRARDVERIKRQYEDPGVSALVISKVDECEQLGGVLHAAMPSGLPIAFVCDGPRVPEDIHNPELDSLLEAILPEAS